MATSPRCAAIAAEGPAAREKVNEMIARLVEHTVRAEVVGETENEQNSSQATRLVRAAVRKGLVGHEEGLEAPSRPHSAGSSTRSQADGHRVTSPPRRPSASSAASRRSACSSPEALAEELAQERLLALKQEHSLVGV
jgi:hypothetical protein